MKESFIVKRVFPKQTINRVKKKINMLGPDSKLNVYSFLNLKLLILIFIFLFVLFISNIGYLLAPAITIVCYFIYDYLCLEIPLKKRSSIIEHDAIFFFEVLALSLESEQNLKLCLEIASDSIDNELSKEVKVALREVSLGKSLTESLENLRERIPSKTVVNVILNLMEASEYGNSITHALNNQIEYITDKRILEIKGQINKMPTKISIISVLFFIPLILLLILAPILINYLVK